tara:strand:+ start:1716 stop:2882 length:1167 start_codon:yes stop_codon:yes gene_type:complete
MSQILDVTKLTQICYGACFLSSGGGGAFSDAKLILDYIINTLGVTEIPLYDVSEAPDDELMCMAGGIGAPDQLQGNIEPQLEAMEYSVSALSSSENPIKGILTVEIGSVNTMLALAICAKYPDKFKLYNYAGADRAVPSLTNLTFAQGDYPADPVALTALPSKKINSDKNICSLLSFGQVTGVEGAADAEALIRPILSNEIYGNVAGLAMWKMTGKSLKASIQLAQTYDKAMKVGEILLAHSTDLHAIVNNIQEYYGAQFFEHFEGTLVSAGEDTSAGYDRGTVAIRPKHQPDNTITLSNVNENILTFHAHSSKAITLPTLMSYLVKQGDDYLPLTNGDDLASKTGAEIALLMFPADQQLYSTTNGMAESFSNTLQQLAYFGAISPSI